MTAFKEIPKFDAETLNRFWSKVAFTANPNVCWNWTSTIRDNKKPYGRFVIKGQDFSSHRIAYFLHNNVDPKELHTLHTCDNPKCCNPAHLFLGTNEDNVADKVSKGRQAVNDSWNKGLKGVGALGENNGQAKLTAEQVLSIREEYIPYTVGAQKLADKYNVSKRLILNIVNRTAWEHI